MVRLSAENERADSEAEAQSDCVAEPAETDAGLLHARDDRTENVVYQDRLPVLYQAEDRSNRVLVKLEYRERAVLLDGSAEFPPFQKVVADIRLVAMPVEAADVGMHALDAKYEPHPIGYADIERDAAVEADVVPTDIRNEFA